MTTEACFGGEELGTNTIFPHVRFSISVTKDSEPGNGSNHKRRAPFCHESFCCFCGRPVVDKERSMQLRRLARLLALGGEKALDDVRVEKWLPRALLGIALHWSMITP